MHAQIEEFLHNVVNQEGLVQHRGGLRVVELGSAVLPGQPASARAILGGLGAYLGVDWRAGPGVDVVGLAHEVPLGTPDVVACCQVLEHDPHWRLTVDAAVRALLAPRGDGQARGGWLLLTWAGPGYPPHELAVAPAGEDDEPAGTYYQPLSLGEVARQVVDACGTDPVTIRSRYERGTLDALLLARVGPRLHQGTS